MRTYRSPRVARRRSAPARPPRQARHRRCSQGAARRSTARPATPRNARPRRDPALRACPRLADQGVPLGRTRRPPTMTLGTRGRKYGPVTFSHRDSRPDGRDRQGMQRLPSLRPGAARSRSARRATPRRACATDLSKPDVQAAMHRQCLECHRDWNARTSAPAATSSRAGRPVRRGAPRRRMKSPTPTAPARVVYETTAAEGKTVTFFHNDHAQRFGLECADCHQQEACATCHGAKAARAGRSGDADAADAPGSPPAPRRTRAARPATRTAECATCHTDTAGPDRRLRSPRADGLGAQPLPRRAGLPAVPHDAGRVSRG